MTDNVGDNAFWKTCLVPLFQNAAHFLGIDINILSNKIQCYNIVKEMVENLGVITVVAGASDAKDYGQADLAKRYIHLNLNWIATADACKNALELESHTAMCVTKLFYNYTHEITPLIMRWMRAQQGNHNPTEADLQTPILIGTKLFAKVEETLIQRVVVSSAAAGRSALPGALSRVIPALPADTVEGCRTRSRSFADIAVSSTAVAPVFVSTPVLVIKTSKLGDMGFGLEEILLGGFRLYLKEEDTASWCPRLLFSTTDRVGYEMSQDDQSEWVRRVFFEPLPAKIANFAQWYRPPRATLKTLSRKRKRKAQVDACESKLAPGVILKEGEKIILLDECGEEDQQTTVPLDSCPCGGRKS